jgi:hypothetical protein
MKNIFKNIMLVSVMGTTMTACQDAWDDHYSQVPDTKYGNASLYQVLSEQPELSDFCRVIDAVKLYTNNKMTEVTYKDLLDGDQFYTVWAPKNGTFNADSLINLCKTAHGDSLVELLFLKNHVARYAHSEGSVEDSVVLMLNGKNMRMKEGNFADSKIEQANLTARNGVIHTLDKPASFSHNIFEAMMNLPQFSHIGDFFRFYQVSKFNESASLASGVVDGKTIYIDSVFTTSNLCLSWYGRIDREDSLYWMLVPTKEVWDPVYEEALSYFNCGAMRNADSISSLYAHDALMEDLFYNPHKWQQRSIQDSIVSTSWSSYYAKYYPTHSYLRPFDEGGLFNQNWENVYECSNGTVYVMNTWPFDKYQTYFFPRRVTGVYDYGGNAAKTVELGLDYVLAQSDTVDGSYLTVTPKTNTDKYFLEFSLPVLSGCYDIYTIVLPKSIDPSKDMSDNTVDGIRNKLPNKFQVDISYLGRDGKEYTVSSKKRYKLDKSTPGFYEDGKKDTSIPYLFEGNATDSKGVVDPTSFVNNPFCVDTIKLCTMEFPVNSIVQTKEATVRLKITNNVKASESRSFADYMFFHGFLLMPHRDN